jgi:hypothetical protein
MKPSEALVKSYTEDKNINRDHIKSAFHPSLPVREGKEALSSRIHSMPGTIAMATQWQ